MPFPILPAIGAAVGLGQAIFGGIKAKKTQKELEGMQTPTYEGSESIMDYYNKALNRYNANPYQSQQYQYASNAANRNQAAGMKTQDELRQFQQNKLAPYEQKYNLLSMKAGAANQTTNAGMGNIFNSLGAATDMKMIDKMYGGK